MLSDEGCFIHALHRSSAHKHKQKNRTKPFLPGKAGRSVMVRTSPGGASRGMVTRFAVTTMTARPAKPVAASWFEPLRVEPAEGW
jgi:hypothetical protein